MKIYAKQINPAYQESPLFYDNMFPENIVVSGNNKYIDHTIPAFDKIIQYFDEMANAWEEANFYYQYNSNGEYIKTKKRPDYTISELLRDYGFMREDGKPWNNHQKHEWKLLFEDGAGADEEETILSCLRLITGKMWECKQIAGCAQGEWNYIYYPVDEWSKAALEAFEAEYFNTGSEWIIDEGDFKPEENDPDEISGYSIYCASWNEEGIKQEIADFEGVDIDDVILFPFE